MGDDFGWFRIVFGPFRTVFDHFRIVSDHFQIVSNRFQTVSGAFRPFSDDAIPNLKVSSFNWPGLGQCHAIPSVQAVPPQPWPIEI